MLVLSRTPGEAIVINHEITVVVLGISGDNVRLGITAPRHIAVHRAEVEAEIEREKLEEVVDG